MSNSWIMEYVNSTDGHVQAGTKIWIPEDDRNEFDLDDSSVGDSMELCDLSSIVPAGTTSIFGYLQIRNASTQDKSMLLVRGYGQTSADSSSPSDYEKVVTLWLEAQIGASSYFSVGSYVELYAPSGQFEYKRYSSGFPVGRVRFTLWGYYVA